VARDEPGTPAEPPSEGELVERAAAGDAEAVELLLTRHLPRLERYVRLRAGALLRSEGVSDLVQSTCREVLEHADRFRFGGEQAFRHWLYATAARKIVSRQRFHTAQRRDVRNVQRDEEALTELARTLGAEPSPSEVAIGAELLARLERAFAALPEEERDVILLSRVVGLSRAEVARAIGRTENGTRNLLHRALGRLSGNLDLGGAAERSTGTAQDGG
jgi:RNA polymerase sigma-70 factor, ECF subfamily